MYIAGFLKGKYYVTGMGLQGPDFSDSRDPIFNSRDPNRIPKTP